MNLPAETETVINLTDCPPDIINDLFQRTAADYGNCRMAIGSYLCSNYFRRLCLLSESLVITTPYDLVLPIFAQHDLTLLEDSRVIALISGAKYLVVNDIGMLMRFSEYGNLRLGRMFFRSYRDHRYPAYEKSAQGIRHSLPLLDSLLDLGFRFCSLECEMTERETSECNNQIKKEGNHATLKHAEECEKTSYLRDEISCENGTCGLKLEFSEKNSEELLRIGMLSVYFHTPYRLVSAMRICEFASIGKPVDRKFIPDDRCCLQCLKTRIFYPDLEFNSGYMKYGKGIYDLAPTYGCTGKNVKVSSMTIGSIVGNLIVAPGVFDEFVHENHGASCQRL